MTAALPNEFLEMISKQIGSETKSFVTALNEPASLALRINPFRVDCLSSAQRFIDCCVPWEPLGYYIKEGTHPGASIEHAAGAFYLQEASAMLSVAVLDPQPGERILDLCAAPGGKTTQIAARMQGLGLLVSNEYEPSRAKVLASNMERMGVPNAIAVNARPDVLAKAWGGYFDALLCDAPCSGEGMFRRDPETRLAWMPASPYGCALRQAEILDSAAQLVRPGGRIVYSTCTFNQFENEDTINAFLDRHPDFYAESCCAEGVGKSSDGMLRIWPHHVRGDGHFCALLRKRGSQPVDLTTEISNSKDDCDLLLKLSREVYPFDLTGLHLKRIKDYLYAVPDSCPDLSGIRTVKPGLCLLRAGKNYIEPEHALAMSCSPYKALRTVELDREQAVRYLAGETLNLANDKGWTLVLYHSLPLGWGKISNDQMKNHLPKGLRLSLHL